MSITEIALENSEVPLLLTRSEHGYSPDVPSILPPEGVSRATGRLAGETALRAMEQSLALHVNSEYVSELIDEQKQEYRSGVTQGVTAGWLHEGADAAISRLDDVRVLAGTELDKHIPRGGGGVYYRSIHTIIMRAGKEGTSALTPDQTLLVKMYKGLKHEFNHGVLGKMPHAWLDEAVTEHIALTMNFGEPEVVYPFSRPTYVGGYVEERRLLHTLLRGGLKQLPISLATRAYSDPEGESYSEFSQAIDESWGISNMLDKIQRQISYYETGLRQDKEWNKIAIQRQAVRQINSDLYEARNQARAA